MIVYRPPKQCIRKPFFKIANSKIFNRVIEIAIIINTSLLCLKWYEMDEKIKYWANFGNDCFSAVFIIECNIKIIGFGRRYFKTKWNLLDFFIVISAISAFSLKSVDLIEGNTATIAMRNLKLLRVLSILKGNESLRVIFSTFLMSLTNLLQIGSLLVLFLFMYGVLGVYLFAKVKRTGILSNHVNFSDL